MEERYNLYSPGSSGWTTLKNEEFQEEEVWSVFRGSKNHTSDSPTKTESSNFIPRPLFPTTASRAIPRSRNSEKSIQILRQSAPVNVPDWSKRVSKSGYDDGGSDDDDEDDDMMMPPHEWIAKKMERSQVSCFSVCEGAGRTLKGRDLSRVRNSVLTKTGFLE